MDKTISKQPLVSNPTPEKSYNCGECRYFSRGDSGMGNECHRKEPTAFMLPGPQRQPVTLSFWPPVRPHQWCGEFKHMDE